MLDVLDLYKANRVKEIESKKDKAIIAIKCEDPTYKALRDAKKSLRGNEDSTVSLRGYTFSKEVNAKIDEVRVNMNKELDELDEFLTEVAAMVNFADTAAKKEKLLKAYGIYNSDNRVA